MLRHRLLAAAFVVLVSGLGGCAPRFQVVAQATPDPFLEQRMFAIAPMDSSELHVGKKTESEFLAGKDQDVRQRFLEDKKTVTDIYVQELTAEANLAKIAILKSDETSSAPFIIRPSLKLLQGGFYSPTKSAPSAVEMTVKITTPDGKVLDEITLSHSTPASMTNASSTSRLHDDAEALAEITVDYLKSRITP